MRSTDIRSLFITGLRDAHAMENQALAIMRPQVDRIENYPDVKLSDHSRKKDGFQFGPLGERWVHLCIDMRRMFAEETDWHTPGMERVLPNVISVVELAPERTPCTRFIPPVSETKVGGTWRRYYRRWPSMSRERLDPGLVELVPDLQRFVPPAATVDKPVMSPWFGGPHHKLQVGGVDAIVVTGAETEVCVLAAMLGGIDLGYRMILVLDGICSSADEMHDAMIGVYKSRYGMQVETITTAEVIAAHHEGYFQMTSSHHLQQRSFSASGPRGFQDAHSRPTSPCDCPLMLS